MAQNPFNGEIFNDDRLFVLHIAKCTVEEADDETVETVIHHESAPVGHIWCVVTYRNTPNYPITRVDHFGLFEEARTFLERTEPTVPLISLDGNSPSEPLSYPQFAEWKIQSGFKEYDYRSMYSLGGENPKEMVLSRRR